MEELDINAICEHAMKNLEEAGGVDKAWHKVERAYPFQRMMLVSRKQVPAEILEIADSFHGKLLAADNSLSEQKKEAMVAALLYLIDTTDVVEDSTGVEGFLDDLAFFKVVATSVNS